jgi:hypothetical protein
LSALKNEQTLSQRANNQSASEAVSRQFREGKPRRLAGEWGLQKPGAQLIDCCCTVSQTLNAEPIYVKAEPSRQNLDWTLSREPANEYGAHTVNCLQTDEISQPAVDMH